MAEDFNPYHRWLGISPKDLPPNHYRLLGLDLFEDDPEAIRDAAEQRMGHVRRYQLGQHMAMSQKILNELALAKASLLDREKKAAYDATLRAEIAQKQAVTTVPTALGDEETDGRERDKAEKFDPYHKWLGIPPEEQPADHYRLLGIKLLESDPDVISNAADKQMAHIRSFQAGQHAALSQQLLNEISTARVSLLNPKNKADYDAALQVDLAKKQAASLPPPPQADVSKENSISDLHSYVPYRSRQKKPSWQTSVAIGIGVVLVIGVVAWLLSRGGDGKNTVAQQAQGIGSEKGTETVHPPSPKPAPKAVETKPESKIEPPKSEPTASESPQLNQPSTTSSLPSAAPPTAPSQPSPPPDESPEDGEKRLRTAMGEAKTPEDYARMAHEAIRLAQKAAANGNDALRTRLAILALATARKSDNTELAKQATLCLLKRPTGINDIGASQGDSKSEEATTPSRSSTVVSIWHHEATGTKPKTLKFLSSGHCAPPDENTTWEIEGSQLRLHWPAGWVDYCTISSDGRSYEGRNQSGVSVTGRLISVLK